MRVTQSLLKFAGSMRVVLILLSIAFIALMVTPACNYRGLQPLVEEIQKEAGNKEAPTEKDHNKIDKNYYFAGEAPGIFITGIGKYDFYRINYNPSLYHNIVTPPPNPA